MVQITHHHVDLSGADLAKCFHLGFGCGTANEKRVPGKLLLISPSGGCSLGQVYFDLANTDQMYGKGQIFQ